MLLKATEAYQCQISVIQDYATLTRFRNMPPRAQTQVVYNTLIGKDT